MEWLLPAIVSNSSASLLLAFTFGFLYLNRRQDFFLFWSAAWGLYSIRFLFELGLVRYPGSMLLLIPIQIILVANGLLLLKGTYRFLNRPIPACWYVAAALTVGHLAAGILIPMRPMSFLLPFFLFGGTITLWNGMVILHSGEKASVGRWMAGCSLILWGIHRTGYPVLRPIAWFAPWGYLIACGFTVLIALGIIILSFERAYRELEETQELLQEIIENTQEVFWVFDPRSRKTLYLSPHYKEVFNREPEEIRRNPTTFYDLIHPDDTGKCRSLSINPEDEKNRAVETSFRFLRPDGTERWLRARVFPFRRTRDRRHLVIGVGEDVTERKEMELRLSASLAEKELLLREIHHRVKNNLQIVVSLLNIHQHDFERSPDSELYTKTQNRIRTIALLHESLYQSGSLARIDMSRYIRQLKDFLAVSAGLEPQRIRFALDIDPIELSIDQASPVALIMNELITNSIKHAFSPAAAGTISISLKGRGENQVCLSVSDNGTSPAEASARSGSGGFGLQLVRNLCRQLEGTMEIRNENGYRTDITFPLPAPAEQMVPSST